MTPGFYIDGGIRTRSMTWITPFDARMFAFTTFAVRFRRTVFPRTLTRIVNRPPLRWRWAAEFGEAARAGLLLVRHATWVSTMFHRDCVERFGLPQEHYFLWTEDVEYTTRILRDEFGYLVPDSRVETPCVYSWTMTPAS